MKYYDDRACDHGDPDCECLDTGNTGSVSFTFTTNTSNNATGGTNSSIIGGSITGGAINFPTGSQTPLLTGPNVLSSAFGPVDPCPNGHDIDNTSIELRGDEIWGKCQTCDVAIRIPRVSGGLNFEKAGQYIGRALTLEEDDKDNSAALLTELTNLEDQVNKEIARLQRTLKLIQIARTAAKKQTLTRALAPIE